MTLEGLQATNLHDIVYYLRERIQTNVELNDPKLRILVHEWNPQVQRPDEYLVLNLDNRRKTHSTVSYRRITDNKMIIVEKGLPTLEAYKDPMEFGTTGEIITTRLIPKKRRRPGKVHKPFVPTSATDYAPSTPKCTYFPAYQYVHSFGTLLNTLDVYNRTNWACKSHIKLNVESSVQQ